MPCESSVGHPACDRLWSLAALVLLNLSAALTPLTTQFCSDDIWDWTNYSMLVRVVPHWFESYLRPATSSCPTIIECVVPQDSVLGPILCLLYVAALQLLIEEGVRPHHFADDTQIYGFCSPKLSLCTELQSRISECIDVASGWMRSHRLQLNIAKTEIIWLTTGHRSHVLPQQPRVGSDLIMPVLVVHDVKLQNRQKRRSASMWIHWRRPTFLPVLQFYVIFRASAARYLGTLILQRPSFSSRRCTDLEQSSAAYHICSVTFCLLLSLEDILLRTLLPVITVVVPVKRHCHLWTR